MTLTPQLVEDIDRARRAGLPQEEIVGHLRRGGVENIAGVLAAYSVLPDHTGRPRGMTNPGDPADPSSVER